MDAWLAAHYMDVVRQGYGDDALDDLMALAWTCDDSRTVRLRDAVDNPEEGDT